MRQGKDLYLPPRYLPKERTNARKKSSIKFFFISYKVLDVKVIVKISHKKKWGRN